MEDESLIADMTNVDESILDGILDSSYKTCEDWTMPNASELGTSEISTVNYVFGIVLTGLIVITGLIGNALSFFVLLKCMNKATTATPIILCALAIVDILFLISSFYLQFIGTLSDGPLKPYQSRIVPLFSFIFGLGNVCRMGRNWLVILVSLERVIAVKSPLKANIIFTKTNATIGVLIIVSASILLCLPRFFEAKISFCTMPDGTLASGAEPSELRLQSVYRYAYTIGFYFLMVTAGPCVLLLILNTLLILQIRRSSVERCALNALIEQTKSPVGALLTSPQLCNRINTSRSDSAVGLRATLTEPSSAAKRVNQYSTEITRICIAIVGVYLICETPPLLYQTLLSVLGDEQPSEFLDVFKPIANFFAMTNSGLNFYIYVFLGNRFRKHLATCKRFKNPSAKAKALYDYPSRTSVSGTHRLSTKSHSRPNIRPTSTTCTQQLQLDNVLHKSYLSVTSEESTLCLPSRESSRRSANWSSRTATAAAADRRPSIRTNCSAPY